MPRTVSQQAVLGEEEQQIYLPSGEPEAIKPVHDQGSLQNGGDQLDKGSGTTGWPP